MISRGGGKELSMFVQQRIFVSSDNVLPVYRHVLLFTDMFCLYTNMFCLYTNMFCLFSNMLMVILGSTSFLLKLDQGTKLNAFQRAKKKNQTVKVMKNTTKLQSFLEAM